jgi:prepilin-type N-terminal cleavage/methylation domain-containing protein
MKEDKGFSLIELAVVIAVIAIMAAVTVPTISQTMRNLKSRTDARSIATALTVAKLKATSQFTRYQVRFSLSQNRWILEKFNKNTGEFESDGAETTLSKEDSDYRVAFQTSSSSAPTGFSTTSSDLIRFNSRGVPINIAGVAIADSAVYLQDPDNLYVVTVSLSGKVQLWQKRSGTWALI